MNSVESSSSNSSKAVIAHAYCIPSPLPAVYDASAASRLAPFVQGSNGVLPDDR